MKKILFIALISVMLSACLTSDNDFIKGKSQLENQGYIEVINTGHSWFCCDEKDHFSTGFSCKDKNGKVVKGCICSGFLKGITIRFE